jgi:hypothetical protein
MTAGIPYPSAMRYASDEAARIIQWILPDLTPGEHLAIELPFRDVKHKADIAISSCSRLSAIEIKGQRDNVQTLPDQLAAYDDMFLDVTVAVAPKHLMFVSNEIPKSVGILLLDRQGIVTLRKPRRKQLLLKESALRWLRSTEIRHLVGHSSLRQLGIEGARLAAIKNYTAAELTEFALRCVAERNKERHLAFITELGPSVTLDDVRMLALPQKIRR